MNRKTDYKPRRRSNTLLVAIFFIVVLLCTLGVIYVGISLQNRANANETTLLDLKQQIANKKQEQKELSEINMPDKVNTEVNKALVLAQRVANDQKEISKQDLSTGSPGALKDETKKALKDLRDVVSDKNNPILRTNWIPYVANSNSQKIEPTVATRISLGDDFEVDASSQLTKSIPVAFDITAPTYAERYMTADYDIESGKFTNFTFYRNRLGV